jgi:transcriptional regulator with XRE-family HTH domain
MDLQKLAEELSQRRNQLGMPLAEVSRRTGIDRYTLWVYERGENPRTGKPSRPAKDRLERLAAVLSVDPDERQEFLAELLKLAGYRGESAAVPDFIGLVHAAKPMRPVRTRTIGQRIDRLIQAAKLSKEEQQIVEEALLGMNRALLALVKTKHRK